LDAFQVIKQGGKVVRVIGALDEIKALVEDEKIKPIIDKVYPYSESIEAFTHLASGRAKGEIVIKIN
jgi:NADPH:quinone reductase-like Zn-dependent oxidoreductase